MKAVGIRRVYYSVNNEIVVEKVSNMISINASSVTRKLEREVYRAPQDDEEYYTKLFLKRIPKSINRKNLLYFLNYNFCNELPSYTWKITNKKIHFYKSDGNLLASVNIIN